MAYQTRASAATSRRLKGCHWPTTRDSDFRLPCREQQLPRSCQDVGIALHDLQRMHVAQHMPGSSRRCSCRLPAAWHPQISSTLWNICKALKTALDAHREMKQGVYRSEIPALVDNPFRSSGSTT